MNDLLGWRTMQFARIAGIVRDHLATRNDANPTNPATVVAGSING